MSIKSLTYQAKRGIFAVSEGSKIKAARQSFYIDVDVQGSGSQRVSFELFNDETPFTASKLVEILNNGQANNVFNINKIVPSLYFNLADVTGLGFEYENFNGTHDREGILSLAEENGRQNLIVTLGDVSWFDGKYSPFGRVVEGLDFLATLERQGDITGALRNNVSISSVGTL